MNAKAYIPLRSIEEAAPRPTHIQYYDVVDKPH